MENGPGSATTDEAKAEQASEFPYLKDGSYVAVQRGPEPGGAHVGTCSSASCRAQRNLSFWVASARVHESSCPNWRNSLPRLLTKPSQPQTVPAIAVIEMVNSG